MPLAIITGPNAGDIMELREALRECADDLAAEIEYRYLNTLSWPSQRAKYDLDMQPVYRARQLLGDRTPALQSPADQHEITK